MSRKRSHYRPKPVFQNPVQAAMAGASLLAEADRMARLNPGHEFVVLMAINTRTASGMVRQQFVTPPPF